MAEYFSFIETSVFTKQIDKLGSIDLLIELQNDLLANPKRGAPIALTKGARKSRVGIGDKGKRGGGRYLYLYLEEYGVIYLLLFYAKNEKDDLTGDEARSLGKLVATIKSNYSGKGK